MPSSFDIPGEIDKIAYDAPLSFAPPAKEWTEAMGGKAQNRTETLTEVDVPPIDLTGKWVLISGANNGIGKEAALTFASWGANLILACKDPRPTEGHPLVAVDECKALAKANGHVSTIEWWKYDAADLTSVEALARRWVDTGRPLEILCNNAGVASTPAGNNAVFKTKDGFEFIFQVSGQRCEIGYANMTDQLSFARPTHSSITTITSQSRSTTSNLHDLVFPLPRQIPLQ